LAGAEYRFFPRGQNSLCGECACCSRNVEAVADEAAGELDMWKDINSGDKVFLRSLKMDNVISVAPEGKVTAESPWKLKWAQFTMELKTQEVNCTSSPAAFAYGSTEESLCSAGRGRVKSGNIVYLKTNHNSYLTAGDLDGEVPLPNVVHAKWKMPNNKDLWQEFIIQKRRAITPEDGGYGISVKDEILLKGHWKKYVGLDASDDKTVVADHTESWRIGSEWVIEKA